MPKKERTMKRIFLIGAMILCFAVSANAQDLDWGWGVETSTQFTANTQRIAEGPGVFYGISVSTDGTNAVTVDVYDSLEGTATKKLIPTWTVTTSATDRAQKWPEFPGVRYYVGIFVIVSTSGTVKYTVKYKPK